MKKGVAVILTAAMTMTATVPAFAETDYNIPNTLERGITTEETSMLQYEELRIDGQNSEVSTTAVGIAAGAYFLPGIGQVLLAATGAITIAGVTIAVGSALYDIIIDWLSDAEEREIAAIKAKIPSRFRTDNGDVDLSKFGEKVSGSSVKYKENN